MNPEETSLCIPGLRFVYSDHMIQKQFDAKIHDAMAHQSDEMAEVCANILHMFEEHAIFITAHIPLDIKSVRLFGLDIEAEVETGKLKLVLCELKSDNIHDFAEVSVDPEWFLKRLEEVHNAVEHGQAMPHEPMSKHEIHKRMREIIPK